MTLIGATTENPYFSVNSPLLSRSLVFRLEPLSRTDVVTLLERALQDPDRGLGGSGIAVDDRAVAYIVDRSGGDARVALNAVEGGDVVRGWRAVGSSYPEFAEHLAQLTGRVSTP